jgi:peroxiredoxin
MVFILRIVPIGGIMPGARRLRVGIVDWLVGFAAFCAALAVVVRPQQDLRLFGLVAVAAYFVAGALRSGTAFAVGRSLIVASGGIAPILLLRVTKVAFTAPLYIPLFIATAIATSLAGAWFHSLLHRQKFGIASIVAAAMALTMVFLVMVAVPSLVHSSNVEVVQHPVQDFVVTTLDGQTLRSQDLHGRVVAVAFWATWCVPCWGELPEIESVYQRFRSDPRVMILAVDIADHDNVEQARAFLTKKGLTMPAAMDTGTPRLETKRSASQSLGRHDLPQIYVLDAEGRVRWVHSGYDRSEQLAGYLVTAVTDVLPQK